MYTEDQLLLQFHTKHNYIEMTYTRVTSSGKLSKQNGTIQSAVIEDESVTPENIYKDSFFLYLEQKHKELPNQNDHQKQALLLCKSNTEFLHFILSEI